MKLLPIELGFQNEVLLVSEYDKKCDIDELNNDWKPKFDMEDILILLRYKDAIILLKDIVKNTKYYNTEPKVHCIKYDDKYYKFSDIKKSNVAYTGYTLDSVKHRGCLNPEKWFYI